MKILYVITEDWFFRSHFLDRAKYVAQSGGKIGIATRFSRYEKEFADLGFELFPIEFSRRGINPFSELFTALKVRKIVRKFKPDITHNIAIKPVVVGSVGELLGGRGKILNALVGMGYVFTSSDSKASFLRPFLRVLLKLLMKSKRIHVVIENSDDLQSLIDDKFVTTDQISLIRGAGVNTTEFSVSNEPPGPIVVTQISRMLRDKGVREFIEAASIISKEIPEIRFQLVGEPDSGNPTAIQQSEIDSWNHLPNVAYLGHRSDIASVISKSHVICLPSYREGLPKSLLEALASGRPVITTDVPGCREVCKNGENGILVPARNSAALVVAIRQLALDKSLRIEMGKSGRLKAESEFSNEKICEETLSLYRKLIK